MAGLGSRITGGSPRIPKVISPRAHAALDYLVVGSTLLAGAWLWRRNRRAAIAAFAAGATELATVLSTNFPGGVFRKMSFPRHAQVSVGQTLALASVPLLMGFQRSPAGWIFAAQAAAVGVMDALTDFQGVGYADEDMLGIGA